MNRDHCDCNCDADVSIEIIDGPVTPACCHSCPPESCIISYGDGTSRVMTDEEREVFIGSLAAPWN